MKHRIPLTIALAVAFAVAVILGSAQRADAFAPLGGVLNCADVTVGAAAASATACFPVGSPSPGNVTVQNESATCIRAGGPSVTASTGLSIGSGCAAGQVVSFDARGLTLISSAGDVTGVDIVWGN